MNMKTLLAAVLGSLVAVVGVTAAPVAAQAPASPKTVTAIAGARANVVKPAKQTDKSIAEAVEAAREKAVPLAIANVKEEALAKAAGLTLGALQSVSEQSAFPYGAFAAYGLEGTFGPGKFCGTISTPVFRRDKNGRRIGPPKFRKRSGCRIPPNVTVTLSATFAAN